MRLNFNSSDDYQHENLNVNEPLRKNKMCIHLRGINSQQSHGQVFSCPLRCPIIQTTTVVGKRYQKDEKNALQGNERNNYNLFQARV